MKNFVFIMCSLILLLTGCSNKSVQDTPRVSVDVRNQKVELQQVDIETDNLLDKDVTADVDFDTEEKIFNSLFDNKISAEFNDEITFKFDKEYQEVIVYDHLLSESGCSYFNKSINQYSLTIDDDTAKIKLSEHPAKALSSDLSFLKSGEIRGFRIILRDSEERYEYAFVINIKK